MEVPVMVGVDVSVGVVVDVMVFVGVSVCVGVNVSVGVSVGVLVCVGVNVMVGVMGVSVGNVTVPLSCARGFMAGAAPTRLTTAIPNRPPTNSIEAKTRRLRFLSRNITGVIASRQ